MTDLSQSDEHDFGKLFVQYQPRIYGYIRSLVIHRADAEDLLQETASVMWRKFDEFRPGSNFLAWALQIARFHVMYLRQRRRRDVLQFSERLIDALAADTVSESSRFADLQHYLDACLEKLSPSDRTLLDLRYRLDATKDVAKELGRPASTIYNAINRIRRALAGCVEREMSRATRE